jgi:polyisoprenyl-phosphate glycosyltransferase
VFMDAVKYSIVVPVDNAEESSAELVGRLREVMDKLDGPAEAAPVDDGSQDASYLLMPDAHGSDPRFKVIQLSRNFGHQLANMAGVDNASGQAVVVMDAGLQDPPEVILEMAAKWQEGCEVVDAVRQRRAGEVRGMFWWIGFRHGAVPCDRQPRHAGTSKYPLRKMIKFAGDAFVGFCTVPLRLALVAGFVIAVLAVGSGVVATALKLAGLPYVPGYASLLVTIAFLGSVQLMVMGMVGQYLARVYDETRGRPLYLVREARGFDSWTHLSATDRVADGFRPPVAPGASRPLP